MSSVTLTAHNILCIAKFLSVNRVGWVFFTFVFSFHIFFHTEDASFVIFK